jgi:tetratricopeptide (TPR) repeat protein
MRYFFMICFLLVNAAVWAQVRSKGLTEPVVTSSQSEGADTYAIVVGVSKYSDKTIDPLIFAHKDAEDFAEFLMSEAGGRVPKEHIKLFKDSTAIYVAIDSAFEALSRQRVPSNSKFIIFFSSHGIRDWQNEIRLKTYDQIGSRSTGVSIDYLKKRVLGFLEMGKMVTVQIYIDACLSGELTSEPFSVIDHIEVRQLGDLKKRSFWMTSSRFDQVSREADPLYNGIFTYFLIRGLKGMADTKTKDGIVIPEELSRYVKDSVEAYGDAGNSQRPQTWGGESDKLELAVVHAETLAAIKNGNVRVKLPAAKMSPVDSVISKNNTEIQNRYKKFKTDLRVFEFRNEAISGFEKLSKAALPEEIIAALKIQLINALISSSNDILSAYVKNDGKSELSRTDIEITISHLQYVSRQFDTNGKQYSILLGSKTFFEGLLSKAQKNSVQAEAKFREAIRLDSTAAFAYNELGIVLTDKGDYNAAVEIFSQGMLHAPDWLFLKNNSGVALSNLSLNQEAIKSFDESSEENPNDSAPHINKAIILTANSERERAIRSYEMGMKVLIGNSKSNRPETAWEVRQKAIDKYEEISSKKSVKESLITKSFNFTEANRYERDSNSYLNGRSDAQIDPKPYEYHQQANKLFDEALYDQAILLYDRAIRLNPNDYKSYYNKGIAMSKSWYYIDTLALAAYDSALSIKPDFARALASKGHTLIDLGRIEEAIECYSNAVLLEPKNYIAYGSKGNALRDRKRYSEAIECYQKAIGIKFDYVSALFNYANLLSDLDSLELAIVYYDRVISCSRNNSGYKVDAFFKKGNALSKLGAYEKSIMCFDSAIALNPRYTGAFNNKGMSLSDLRRYREAITCFELAIKIDSSEAKFFNNKGYAQMKLGNDALAIRSFDKATFLKTDFELAFYNRGNTFANLGKYPEAIENYQIAIGIDPKYVTAYTDMGLALEKLKKYDEAIVAFDHAIELDSSDPFAHLYRGSDMVFMECFSEAIESFENAISIDSTLTEAFLLKGIVLKEIGENNQAIQAFDKVIALDPSHSSVYIKKAFTLLDLNHSNDAVALFEKAIKTSDQEKEVYRGYALALLGCEKHRDALKVVNKLLKADSSDYSAHLIKGLIFTDQYKFDAGLLALEKAILIDGENELGFLWKGIILFEVKRHEDALSALKKASGMKYGDLLVLLHFTMGESLRLLGRYQDAVESYNLAIGLSGKCYGCYVGKAHTLYSDAKFDESIIAIDKAIEIKPDDYDAHFHKGSIYFKLKNYQAGLDVFTRAIEIKKDSKAANNNRGYALRKLARPEAFAFFNQIIDRRLDYYLTYYNLACLYARQNKEADALVYMKKALKKGYRNFVEMDEDSDLNDIRHRPAFAQLIQKYRK